MRERQGAAPKLTSRSCCARVEQLKFAMLTTRVFTHLTGLLISMINTLFPLQTPYHVCYWDHFVTNVIFHVYVMENLFICY